MAFGMPTSRCLMFKMTVGSAKGARIGKQADIRECAANMLNASDRLLEHDPQSQRYRRIYCDCRMTASLDLDGADAVELRQQAESEYARLTTDFPDVKDYHKSRLINLSNLPWLMLQLGRHEDAIGAAKFRMNLGPYENSWTRIEDHWIGDLVVIARSAWSAHRFEEARGAAEKVVNPIGGSISQ